VNETKSIDIVHNKKVRLEGQSKSGEYLEWGRKGSVPFFHSPFVFPFLHFSYGQCQCFWFKVAPNKDLSKMATSNHFLLSAIQSVENEPTLFLQKDEQILIDIAINGTRQLQQELPA
jgi:hypothetical protein